MKRHPEQLAARKFDLVIIGGGVTGVALAREAAVRGQKVALVEKRDFGWATSAATSRLLHGGLRYLENFEFSLVRESIRERRDLGNAAPHLVRPMPFLIPIYRKKYPPRWRLKLGLWLYDLLAFDRNRRVPEDLVLPPSEWINRKEVMKRAPEISSDGLRGGYVYYELQNIYPERLLLDWAATAAASGATLCNHCECVGFDMEPDENGQTRATVARVRDMISGDEYSVHGHVFVNATGPWLTSQIMPTSSGKLELARSTGIHFITDALLPEQQGVVFYPARGGHFFIIPWRGYSLIGLTDEPYDGAADDLHPREKEIQQLFEDVNAALPGRPLRPEMIRNIITGIRPLVFSGGGSSYKASRKSEIHDHLEDGVAGMISVAGGKWTTSRQLGEDIVEHLEKGHASGNPWGKNKSTEHEALISAPGFGESARDYLRYARALPAADRCLSLGLRPEALDHLIQIYGKRHADLLGLIEANPTLAETITGLEPEDAPEVLAQVEFAIQEESAIRLDDVIRRRLVLGLSHPPKEATLLAVADYMAKRLNWDDDTRHANIAEVTRHFTRALQGIAALRSANNQN